MKTSVAVKENYSNSNCGCTLRVNECLLYFAWTYQRHRQHQYYIVHIDPVHLVVINPRRTCAARVIVLVLSVRYIPLILPLHAMHSVVVMIQRTM